MTVRLYVEQTLADPDCVEVTCNWCETAQMVERRRIRTVTTIQCRTCYETFYAGPESASEVYDVRLIVTTDRRWTHRLREMAKRVCRWVSRGR